MDRWFGVLLAIYVEQLCINRWDLGDSEGVVDSAKTGDLEQE